MSIRDEIKKRRTFAIISHPDAGKTTITEQLLYFGGEIREAGTVKGKKTGNFAKSDWMDIEKQRGISVTSSVMQFDYAGKRVNILDTPGHEDFSEDTYRTLMAADAAARRIRCPDIRSAHAGGCSSYRNALPDDGPPPHADTRRHRRSQTPVFPARTDRR